MYQAFLQLLKKAYSVVGAPLKRSFEKAIVETFKLGPEFLKNPEKIWSELFKIVKDKDSLKKLSEVALVTLGVDALNDMIGGFASVESKEDNTGALEVTNHMKLLVDRTKMNKEQIVNDPRYTKTDWFNDNLNPLVDGPVEIFEKYNEIKKELSENPILASHDSARVNLSNAYHAAKAMESKLDFMSRVLRVDRATALKFVLDAKTIDESYSFLINE